MTININLTPQLEAMVRDRVASGLYASASEVVREALRLLQAQDRLHEARLAELRRDVREGLESGPPSAWDPEQLKQEARAMRAARTDTAAS